MGYEKNVKKTDSLNEKSWELMVSDPEKALLLADQASELAHSVDYKMGIAGSLLNKGWYYIYKSETLSASEALNKGLKICEDLNTADNKYCLVKTLNALGVVYQLINQYDTSLDYFSRCLKISSQTDNNEYVISSLGNIGLTFLELGKYEEALQLFEQENGLIEGTELHEEKCNNLQSRGIVYLKLKDYEKALSFLNQSYEIASDIDYKVGKASALIQMGNVYLQLSELQKAENNYVLGLELSRELDYKISEVECLTSLGKLKFRQNKYRESIDFHKQALSLSKSIKSKLYEYKNYRAVSEVLEKTGDHAGALENFKMFYSIKNKFSDEETEKRLKHIAVQGELDNKQKENEIFRLKNVELKEAYNNISVISRIGREITNSLDMETIMHKVSENVKNLMPADYFGIALYDRDTKEIDFRYYVEGHKRIPDKVISLDSGESLAARCIKNNRDIFINNAKKEVQEILPDGKVMLLLDVKTMPESIIYIPLRVKDCIIGVMTVQAVLPCSYTEKHLEILKTLASYISIALDNSKIHEELNKMNRLLKDEKNELEAAYEKISLLANHDNLTGLPNRKLLYELLIKCIQKAKRAKGKIGLLFIDLDGFKRVNDSLGHEAGDSVLREIGNDLKDVLRLSDIVARIGGDEFIVVIPDLNDNSAAEKIADKIISKLSSRLYMSFHVGASIGISIYPDDDTEIKGLIEKADIAMYYVKGKEKNSFYYYNDIKIT